MFVFGTQYLRGASPERDQWDRDMANMRAMGFNTIRAWLVWNTCEPEEGKIDFDYITSFLDCAKKHDLQVGLLFHLHAAPDWMIKKYPQYYYIDEDHRPFVPGIRANTPSGGWPGLCYNHDEVRELEKRFITGVISATKKYDNVAFYEPMNEPHSWINFQRKPSGIFCYCPACIKKFQVWLEKKYGDIQTLNKAWGHFYGSFDEILPPRWMHSYSDYTDFRLFTVENVVEEIAYRTSVIKSCDDKPVIAHAWGGGSITCAGLGGMAFDDWKNAKVFDKWGFSAFPQQDKDCVTLGLGCDATRCASNGKEFWQSELTAGLVGTGLHQQGRVSDKTFNKFSLESIRHGATGLLYWQYRKEIYGSEFGGFSMTDYAGGPTNLSRCAERLCKMLQKNEDVFNNYSVDPAEVGLVFSIRSFFADWVSNGRMNNKFAVDSMSGYYKMFWEENMITDIIHEELFGDLSKYKLIILPSPYAVSAELAAALKDYIANGGTVLSDPYFGAFDKDMRLSYQVPGYGFADVFGCEEDDMREAESCVLTGAKNAAKISGNRHRESFRNVTADVLYSYEDGTPAILSNKWGKGRALISGVNLGLSYSSRALVSDDIETTDTANVSVAAKAIVMQLCEELGIKGNNCSAAGVKVSVLKTEGEADGIVFINSNSKEMSGELTLDRTYAKAESVLGDAAASFKDGKLCFTLAADESAVVRLTK